MALDLDCCSAEAMWLAQEIQTAQTMGNPRDFWNQLELAMVSPWAPEIWLDCPTVQSTRTAMEKVAEMGSWKEPESMAIGKALLMVLLKELRVM